MLKGILQKKHNKEWAFLGQKGGCRSICKWEENLSGQIFQTPKEMGRKIGGDTPRDDLTGSDSYSPLPHSPFPHLRLFPKLPPTFASNIHPAIHQSVIHMSTSVTKSCYLQLDSRVRTCSDRRSTGRSSISISSSGWCHMLSCWIPPLLLHKDTLTLLQCSIGCCCATALKIPQGQWEENLNIEKLFSWERQSCSSLSVTWGWESALQ